MNRNRGHVGIEVLAILAVLALVFGLAAAASAYSCSNKWRLSGLSTNWGFFQGCVVQMPSGRWVPEKNVRDMDLSQPQTQAPRAEIPR
jgi:hypothetical protein